MICSSVHLVRFIARPFVGSDSNSKCREIPLQVSLIKSNCGLSIKAPYTTDALQWYGG